MTTDSIAKRRTKYRNELALKKAHMDYERDKANGEKLPENLFVTRLEGVKKSVCLCRCLFVWTFNTTTSHRKCPESRKKAEKLNGLRRTMRLM